ncbi:NAD(P)H-dependent oxidoreductase [Methylibium rhizosphaerae]|jgi:glutathione-regulated potassium-efflux system ancillary protein KefF|uniref:glutathione-regulated potassium-efflux system oxidoreductase KefF n=1 Tax=Methylibium rhizosphaerae TaxID=2570323 RepID=UPI00112D003C|nr:NAD(P)H-dependent oxidoreductase [Methylibium rhizosphaerae]
MARALVLLAHPDLRHSRVTRALMAAMQPLQGPGLAVRDLYALYPDYVIDVPAEQAELAKADLVVWLHPFHWYSMPSLMKLWLDEVLAYGWAYGHDGRALEGKDLWLVTSTGGGESAYHPAGYNRYFFDAFMPPYEQTAALCGMRFLPPMVLHAAHKVDTASLHKHAALFAERLASYPAWPELAELEEREICDVPEADRPQDAVAV